MSRARHAIAIAAIAVLATVPPATTAAANQTRSRSTLEVERLNLEDARLRREAGPEGLLQRYAPPATLLLGVAGGLYGFYRYRDEQRRARALRIEQDIAKNLELLQLPDTRSAGVLTALRNLASLLLERPKFAKARRTWTGQRERVTDALDAVIRSDLIEMSTTADARTPAIALDEWTPFAQRAGADGKLCQLVCGRYLDLLGRIARDYPGYCQSVRRDDDGRYSAEHGTVADPLLFESAVDGFAGYALLLAGQEQADMIMRFAQALDNQALADQLPNQTMGASAATVGAGLR